MRKTTSTISIQVGVVFKGFHLAPKKKKKTRNLPSIHMASMQEIRALLGSLRRLDREQGVAKLPEALGLSLL